MCVCVCVCVCVCIYIPMFEWDLLPPLPTTYFCKSSIYMHQTAWWNSGRQISII